MSELIQSQTCERYGVAMVRSDMDSIFGFALNSSKLDAPLHGLRHTPVEGMSGWYIWTGEYDSAADFFSPLHLKHAAERCSEAIPFLGLPEGWRFLVKGDYVDVWFDEQLLKGNSP